MYLQYIYTSRGVMSTASRITAPQHGGAKEDHTAWIQTVAEGITKTAMPLPV